MRNKLLKFELRQIAACGNEEEASKCGGIREHQAPHEFWGRQNCCYLTAAAAAD